MSRRGVALALGCTAAICVAAGLGNAGHSTASTLAVARLEVVQAQTPPLRLRGYDTKGTYPQVRARRVDLRAANAALRSAVLADQRSYAAEARRQHPPRPSTDRGVYRTAVDRRYLSASTVVVSALLPVTEEAFAGQHGGDGWLGMTVLVPSGRRVVVTDLFVKPNQGIRVLAAAWKARIRRTGARPCLSVYASAYAPTASNYSSFALTPSGIVVGSWEVAACYRLVATVQYATLRPYLSRLGTRLVAGVRRPY